MTRSGDTQPAQTLYAAAEEECASLTQALVRWQDLNQHDVAAFNALLQKNGEPALPAAKVPASGCGVGEN